MEKCTRDQGFTEISLLQYGLDCLEAAEDLFFGKKSGSIDPAGYLAQLGIELLLKAWHLHLFDEFEKEHGINKLYSDLTAKNNKLSLDDIHQKYLKRLSKFYDLRYPNINKPIRVGHDDWEKIQNLLYAIGDKMPESLHNEIKKIDPTEKGGRVLLFRYD